MVATFNYFYRADVVIAAYVSGAKVTRTYRFVNKAANDDSSQLYDYWPVLLSVGEVTLAVGDPLPNVTFSQVTINNRRGSFGANRKFSDVLERYSPIEQEITVYVAQEATVINAVFNWVQLAKGTVANWDSSPNDSDEQTLTFNIRPVRVEEKILTLEVNRSISGMENAPEASLGKAVPLIVGQFADVVPVRISADGSTTVKYAWGTCFSGYLRNASSGSLVYTKGHRDEWARIYFGATDYSGGTIAGQFAFNHYNTVTRIAWRMDAIDVSPSSAFVVTGLQLRAKANGFAARVSTGQVSFFLLKANATTKAVIEEVGSGKISLATYDTLNNNAANTNFAINVSFDQPLVLDRNGGEFDYYFGWDYSGIQVDDLSINRTATTVPFMYVTSTNSWQYSTTGARLLYKLHELTASYTDTVAGSTQTGLSYSSLTLSQFTPDSGQANPSLDSLPIVLQYVSGLTWVNTGTLVSRAQEVIDALSYIWDGNTSTWTNPQYWDLTTLQASHYDTLFNGASPGVRSRIPRGVFDQKVTFSQVVGEICRGMVAQVGMYATGKLFVYPWGASATPAANIPPADIAPLGWQQGDVSNVINRAIVNVLRSPLASREFDPSREGATPGYYISSDFSAKNYAPVATLTAESRALYGDKSLSNTNFPVWPAPENGKGDYLGAGSFFGSVLAEFFITRYAKPLVRCSFVVPWHRYSGLKMFDVINFAHPDFPAFYGTDPEEPLPVVDTGSSVVRVDPNGGNELVRAQVYRGLIEGISYILAFEHAPALRLSVLVLLNYPADPT